MKQKPDNPKSGSRSTQLGLGRFVAEGTAAGELLFSAPLRVGGACTKVLGGGRNVDDDTGEDVLGGLWDWALRRPVGSPPNSPGSRSSWNMSTNSCCSSSKLSCSTTYGLGERTDLETRWTVEVCSGDGTRMF